MWRSVQDYSRNQMNKWMTTGIEGEHPVAGYSFGNMIKAAPNQALKNLRLAMGENFGNVMDRSNAAAGPGDVIGTWMLKSFLRDNPDLNWLQTGGPSQKWD